MHDLLIRGGTIVDGTGAKPFTGDVAVDGGCISAVGKVTTAAREVIDADGLLVTPGWVDIHAHYDGQVSWDPLLTPSFWHGVTTVVVGNCGVGFAPVRPEQREFFIQLMEGVEGIPSTAMLQGIDWQWESFPEYLDALGRIPHAIDVGSMITHGPLRVYVMGERGVKNEPATPEDIAQMAALVREALAAGALGFSTSRTRIHVALDGEPVPGTFAAEEELSAIAKVISEAGHGLIEVIPAGIEGSGRRVLSELAMLRRIAQETGCPITFLIGQTGDAHAWRDFLRVADEAAVAGGRMYPQIAGRPVNMLFSFDSEHPFAQFPSFQEVNKLPQAERLARLHDPQVRARILADKGPDQFAFSAVYANPWHNTYVLGTPPNYEPDPATSVAAVAQREGRSPAEVGYDLLLQEDASAFLVFTAANYVEGNLNAVQAMLTHPQSVLGGGDGGAHCNVICDAGAPTWMLTYWTRDRTRGERLPLEWVVKKQTLDNARFFGLHDRGAIRPGLKADVNVIDYNALEVSKPYLVDDLPGGAKRLMQTAVGYKATVVAGQVVQRNGQETGARPGTVVRGRRG